MVTNQLNLAKKGSFVVLCFAMFLLSSYSFELISVQDVFWGHLLKCRGNLLIGVIDELATSHINQDSFLLFDINSSALSYND